MTSKAFLHLLPLAGEGRDEGGWCRKSRRFGLGHHPHPALSRQRERVPGAKCDSPGIGAVLFLAAIAIYIFSEDLSMRPYFLLINRHPAA